MKKTDVIKSKTTRKLQAVPSASSAQEALRPLSLKEKNVLEFLESHIAQHSISPSYQEICKHFGFASFNSVQRYLKQLEAKGYIQTPGANQKRAIQILHSASSVKTGAVHPGLRPEVQPQPTDSSDRDGVLPAIMPAESLSLPLLGRVAAGAPIEAMEHDEFIDVPASLVRHADRTYALRVQGQSMIEDGIFDGDVILVQRQATAQNGEIVVAVVGGESENEATVKRFYLHRDVKNAPSEAFQQIFERQGIEDAGEFSGTSLNRLVELRPANSTMKPMWFDPNEVQIRGVVVGLIRRFF